MTDPFIRSEWLLGPAGMARLRSSKVAVFGIGGVGSYTVEALARSGVGHLVLVDHDRVELSNINRQLHATMATLGQSKVKVMRERVLSINPRAEVTVHECFFQPGDPDSLLSADLDYVVDAIDTVPSKIGLIVRAKELGLPIISCMGAGNKLDPTRFEVADIDETSVCPLSKIVRRELRKQGISQVKVVFSREQPQKPQRCDQPVDHQGDTQDDDPLDISGAGVIRPRRNSPGSVAFVPSVAGLIIAGEVVKDLIDLPDLPGHVKI
ncbi:MAG: tRNA threonylcarbamoyladenosine dehydratase [Bacillota bacterium]|nr:tRNA threonylcarbamoyladenosine dehydratase [Bacillota bacterium]